MAEALQRWIRGWGGEAADLAKIIGELFESAWTLFSTSAQSMVESYAQHNFTAVRLKLLLCELISLSLATFLGSIFGTILVHKTRSRGCTSPVFEKFIGPTDPLRDPIKRIAYGANVASSWRCVLLWYCWRRSIMWVIARHVVARILKIWWEIISEEPLEYKLSLPTSRRNRAHPKCPGRQA